MDINLASCSSKSSEPCIDISINFITDSLSLSINGLLHNFKFSLSEDWENFSREFLEEGSDSSFLAFTSFLSKVLLVSIVHILDESFNSLSLNSNYGISSNLHFEVFGQRSKSRFNCVNSGFHDASDSGLGILSHSSKFPSEVCSEVLEGFDLITSVGLCFLDSLVAFQIDSIGKSTEGLVNLLLHALVCVSAVAFSLYAKSNCGLLSLGKHVSASSLEFHCTSSCGDGCGSNNFGLHGKRSE